MICTEKTFNNWLLPLKKIGQYIKLRNPLCFLALWNNRIDGLTPPFSYYRFTHNIFITAFWPLFPCLSDTFHHSYRSWWRLVPGLVICTTEFYIYIYICEIYICEILYIYIYEISHPLDKRSMIVTIRHFKAYFYIKYYIKNIFKWFSLFYDLKVFFEN